MDQRDELEKILRAAISTATGERVAPEDIEVQFQEQRAEGVSCSIGGIAEIARDFKGVAPYVKSVFLEYLSFYGLQLGSLEIMLVP